MSNKIFNKLVKWEDNKQKINQKNIYTNPISYILFILFGKKLVYMYSPYSIKQSIQKKIVM